MQHIRIGIVGLGKIALDEHVPALRSGEGYDLVAATGKPGRLAGVPCFDTIEAMLENGPALDAVAICTPPQAHHRAAKAALCRGKHVIMEKPPCVNVDEFDELVALARQTDCTLFQTWHVRETAAVEAAVPWLSARRIRKGRVVWKEDVCVWHPGQTWIWQEGGFGVLDAGINAISILTKILPAPLTVETARLLIPANCESPIAAAVAFRMGPDVLIASDFDFRPVAQEHSITLETDAGRLALTQNGAVLSIDGEPVRFEHPQQEYDALYRRFAQLIASGQSDTDKRPLELVADIFRLAVRTAVEPFVE